MAAEARGSSTRNKNMAMAARMKAEGVRRNVARCPICYRIVSLSGLYHHIVTCR